MRRKRLLATVVALVLMVVPLSVSASGSDEPAQETISQADTSLPIEEVPSTSYIILEQSTKKIVAENDAYRSMEMGSFAKIMTLILAFDALENGTISTDDVAVTSEYAANLPGTEIWLVAGEEISVHDLLLATAMGSANDAAAVLAEHISGSEEAFVAQMNQKALELGMVDTTFVNASGIEHETQMTTAYDVALMSAELLNYEKYREYSTVWMVQIRGGQTEIVNTNRLARFYDGCVGLKTSFTESTQNCISAAATRNNVTFLSVSMESETMDDSFRAARSLLDYAFGNFTMATLDFDETQIVELSVKGGVKDSILPVCEVTAGIVVPIGREADIAVEVVQTEEVSAPVEVGQTVGSVRFLLDGESIYEIPIKSQEAVEKMTWFNALQILLSRFFT